MAVSRLVTVTSSPTLIADDDSMRDLGHPIGVIIRNADAAASIYLGGATVTSAAGTTLKAQEWLTFDLAVGRSMHGCTASGSVVLEVMELD